MEENIDIIDKKEEKKQPFLIKIKNKLKRKAPREEKKIEKVIKMILFIFLLLVYPFVIKFFMATIYNCSFADVMYDVFKRFYTFEWKVKTEPFTAFKDVIDVLYVDYLAIMAILLIFIGIFKKFRPAIIMTTILFIGIAVVNNIVYQFRGTPFSIFDILVIRTAIGVFGDYKVNFVKLIVLSVIAPVVFTVVLVVAEEKRINLKIPFRLAFVVVGMIVLLMLTKSKVLNKVDYWNLYYAYRQNGQIVAFLREFRDAFKSKKPEGYSTNKSLEILSSYSDDEKKIDENIRVIVIMNESFSDINTTYDLNFPEDNLKFFNSLKEDTVRGWFYTSVIGGLTANVEWECLTGNSYAFVLNGGIPYVLYVNSHVDNFTDLYNRQELSTLGFHPYLGTSYNRDSVYKYMGFDHIFFSKDFAFHKTYPDDIEAYHVLVEQIEQLNTNFNFLVTMQNHGPYKLIEGETDNQELNGYLSKIKDSDEALEWLITTLKEKNEKYVVLLFGDHQPAFVTGEEFNKEDNRNYQVPFIIWANFDIEEKENIRTSSNYLLNILSDVVGLPKSQYRNYTSHVQEKVPAINIFGYYGDDGKWYDIMDEESPYKDILEDYKIVQYYEMFEKK